MCVIVRTVFTGNQPMLGDDRARIAPHTRYSGLLRLYHHGTHTRYRNILRWSIIGALVIRALTANLLKVIL
jgi:hypothetical protein